MRTRRSAAVSVVSKLMNVEATLSVRIAARDIVSNYGGRRFGGLFEYNGTRDFRISSKDGNYEKRELAK